MPLHSQERKQRISQALQVPTRTDLQALTIVGGAFENLRRHAGKEALEGTHRSRSKCSEGILSLRWCDPACVQCIVLAVCWLCGRFRCVHFRQLLDDHISFCWGRSAFPTHGRLLTVVRATAADTRLLMHKKATGRVHTQETKEKIRRSMLAAHAKRKALLCGPPLSPALVQP